MFRSILLVTASLMIAIPFAIARDGQPSEPFNGKDLKGWKFKDEKKNKWEWYPASPLLNPDKPNEFLKGMASGGPPCMVNVTGGGTDISTEATYGDGVYEVEFMVPKGSNSGIYIMGEYEVQILDSYGKPDDKLGMGDLGALYSAAAPKKNAAKKPGEWQKFIIEFQAPRFADGKKTANAKFVKVTLNDVVIHENIEMKSQTPGGLTGKESSSGPLMFQGDHGPVAYRNIKITPRK